MKNRNTFFMNVRSGLCSADFILATIGIAVLCYVSVSPYLLPKEQWSNENMLMVFELIIGLSTFKKILVILAATPFAASFCNDWNCQYMRAVVIRSGIRKYIWSKIIACTVIALMTVFVGVSIFVGILGIWIPLTPQDISMAVHPPFDTISEFSPVLYLIINIFFFSLGCAFWVVVGLAISAFLPNRFVAIITPLIASYILEELTANIFPLYINLYSLTRVRDVINQGAGVSFLYYIAIFGLFIFLLGLLFSYQVKRRIHNEVT